MSGEKMISKVSHEIPEREQRSTFIRNGQVVLGHQDEWKCCSKCGQFKNQIDFPTTDTDGYGRKKLRSQCRVCRNKGSLEAQNMRNHIKIPKPDVCPICLVGDKKLQVDHDHETKKFRAWICNTCNTCQGRLKDDPMYVARMLKNLIKNGDYKSKQPLKILLTDIINNYLI